MKTLVCENSHAIILPDNYPMGKQGRRMLNVPKAPVVFVPPKPFDLQKAAHRQLIKQAVDSMTCPQCGKPLTETAVQGVSK